MIKLLSESDFDAVYSLMSKSFPKDEYRTYSGQKALLKKSEYKIYGVKADSGELQAFAAVWAVGEMAFLEHLAVDPSLRGHGMGADILCDLVHLLGKTIFLEVEPPADELTERRIGFYRRNGFFLNEYPYVQPPLSHGKQPVPLLIMTYGKAVSKREFENIKESLYARIYQCI